MNTIELYKRLPKKNCGECRQKTCMPFALALIKGDAELSECSYLTDSEVTELQQSIRKSSWQEELITKLRNEVSGIPFSEIANAIGAELNEGSLVLQCFGRQFTVAPDGEITTQGRMTPWIKILILHYIRSRGADALAGKWVSYSELKSGMVKAASFLRECEEPLRELLDADYTKVAPILERFGARISDEFPTQHAWRLCLLPKLPVVILYWPAEDEFDSKVKILFDESADKFLDVESIIFLLEGLVKNIEAGLAGQGKG